MSVRNNINKLDNVGYDEASSLEELYHTWHVIITDPNNREGSLKESSDPPEIKSEGLGCDKLGEVH